MRRQKLEVSEAVQPAGSGDLEYFHSKPLRNWRIRAKQQGENKLMLNAQISGEPAQVIVFRPRRSEDFGGNIYVKAFITAGPHNDVVDPWLFIGGSAVRASMVWKRFQSAPLSEGYEALLDQLELDSFGNNGFEEWCLEDIERTARLAWSIYGEAPLLKEFGSERTCFTEWRFDDVKERLTAMATATGTDPEALDRAIKILAGWKAANFWGSNTSMTLDPSPELFDALAEDDYADTPVVLPFPSILIDANSFDAATMRGILDRSEPAVHGYVFSQVRVLGEPILQFGELHIDGQISYGEIPLQYDETVWYDVAAAAQKKVVDWEAFTAALRVLAAYTLHRKTGRRIGLEVLPPTHRHAPKKAPVMTVQPIQKPAATIASVSVPPARNPIADILERIQAAYEERQKLHAARVIELQRALDVYADAAKNDLLLDFARRNGVDGGDLRAPDAALYLSDLIDKLPEIGGAANEISVPMPRPAKAIAVATVNTDACEPAPTTEMYAKIRAQTKQVVLVGGRVIKEKMPWFRAALGYEPEWIGTYDETGSNESQKVATRMNNGKVLAVIFFQSFMSHKQTEPLLEAARSSGVPAVAGGRAGQGEVARALATIEEAI